MKKLIIILLLFISAVGPIAWASPSPLHIGSGYGTPCQLGDCPLYNGEVNNIGMLSSQGGYAGFRLDIYQNSGGAGPITAPILLILGVPNDSKTANRLDAGIVTGASIIDGQTSVGTAMSFTFDGFQGLMTGGSEVYGFLASSPSNQSNAYPGLWHVNHSNSFANWHDWDVAVDNIDASNFGIYAYAFTPINGSAFGANDFIDVSLSGLPEGTFAVAYGQIAGGNGKGHKKGKAKAYGTPFTQAGLVDQPVPVPEPSSLAVLGLGIVLLGLRKKLRDKMRCA